MARTTDPQYPPLLLRYLKMFQEDPTSRIFAPLSEAYRKLGLVDDAIEICLEGMSANPSFVGGRVALARAYADKGLHQDVHDALAPVIDQIPDNLVAQKLFAQSCLPLGEGGKALSALKLVLYFNPDDTEVRGLVQELETQSIQRGGLLRGDRGRRIARLQGLLERVQTRQNLY